MIVNLSEKFDLFDEYWSPKIVGELNGQYLKLVKAKGEFVWHSHEHEDEMFWVVKGELQIAFRDKTVTLKPGEMTIIPKGVEHKPMAKEEVHIAILEPKQTQQTGGVNSELLVEKQPWI